ncbi:Peptidoglycan/xylan/chitin deacetylase, PgdA/CDA1 family [Zobellia uliginosa]|uniref:Peptidoglycan/xylan/chitin deacetylase, PgdA/CDA1 family n=1 Tax=Zobellia uliginosa TaxID=143224 RepID=A0ABY1L5B7_9FLAO|nr:polysaccharide deacetylase family protein [Zobellia uliginosa]SIT05727.1 Peptidoglycan/xylan/chitin deacetylase, PgdA/CDA1 family [Zobellia uliginosa]
MLRRKRVNTTAVFLLLPLVALCFMEHLPWWPVFALLFLWFSLTVFGSFFIQWNYHLTSKHANKNIETNWVSITFDDGPNPEFTPKALELLAKYNAKATFFCVGQRIEKHPEILKQIISQGHTIGNHTYSHANTFGFLSLDKVLNELVQTKDLVHSLTGKKIKLYRPAFGVTNPQIAKAVDKLKVHSIGWSVRSLDTTSRSEETVLKRITNKVSKGDIILLHDTNEKTIAVLEQLLLFLRKKNLSSVTVDRLLEIEAYA